MLMIIQSKMNNSNTFPGSYKKAFIYLNAVRPGNWISIAKIPKNIRYQVIDLIDRGFNINKNAYFDEFILKFKVERISLIANNNILKYRCNQVINYSNKYL